MKTRRAKEKEGDLMETEGNILVVEDDNAINQLLCKIAKRNNYTPQPAFSGTEAQLYFQKQEWDLVLLDLMLPGKSGEEVLGEIVEQSDVPVIIISAKNETQAKIDCLRTGAADYITKPFHIEEVSARMDSHLLRYRRSKTSSKPPHLTFKDINIDLEAKTVVVNGQLLKLTVREYAILELLVSSPKKMFSKANLFESVWQENFHGDDNTVNAHMSNLRTKLAKANPDKEYIETIWGMGYRLKN
nr:response regulator transcription factor [Planomicrobium okeanokoites]